MTKPCTIIRRSLFGTRRYDMDRNDLEVINSLFALPGLYSNILKTEKMLQFRGEKSCGHSSAKG